MASIAFALSDDFQSFLSCNQVVPLFRVAVCFFYKESFLVINTRFTNKGVIDDCCIN